ncbi:hypothetical protein [Sorangium sp. Soce836]|nr:hypothetical protein [Sorangium sp. Soce836]
MLLGGPNSGKTHYAGQLYGRLRRRPGRLQLREGDGTPTDLSALEEVLHCLENGRAAKHTSAGTWSEVLLPLVDGRGQALDLLWPDYGGEQLSVVFEQRTVSEAWRDRLVDADGWMLLIRLKAETTYRDAIADLAQRRTKEGSDNETSIPAPTARTTAWDANARWVELLQILLHVAGLGTVGRIARPRLAVLLSCYDELVTTKSRPFDVLAETMPLLSSFLESTWKPEHMSVWGLSALGRLLEENSADERFIDQGPERQGWVVAPQGGETDPDLSRPLAWLLGDR